MIEAMFASRGVTAPLPVPDGGARLRVPRIPLIVAGSLVFWVAAWWLVAWFEIVPPLFLPSPVAVANRFVTTLQGGFADATLLHHAGASLGRVLAALGCALLVAVPIGLGMGLSPVLRGVLDPVIEAYRPIPPLAYLPLVVIWFGIGEGAKVLLIFLAIVPAIALSTASGVRSVPLERIKSWSGRGSGSASGGRRWSPPSWSPPPAASAS